MAPATRLTWDGGHTRRWPRRRFRPGHSSDYWTIALLVSGFGSIGTAINLIATILCMRCPGMTLSRMPLLAWLNLVMSGMVLIAITPLSAAQIMLLIDRYLGGHFFDTQAGGSAAIWMHFFWIFGHPEVYILIIPCFAFMSEIIPVFSRKPIFGYPVMVGATVCIAFVSLSVWAHHMFTIGMNSYANSFFAITTMASAFPPESRFSTGWAPCGAAAFRSKRRCSFPSRFFFSS